MYKNIIFDLGGVMVDFDPKTYLVDRFCNAEVEEQVSQLTFESEAGCRAYHPLRGQPANAGPRKGIWPRV